MKTFLMVVLCVVSLVLILSVLFQETEQQGLSGAINGSENSLFGGKKKGNAKQSLLAKITTVSAILFVALAIVLILFQ